MLKPLCPNWQHNSLLCFLLVTAVHCHVLTIFASSQYCWLLLCTATCYFRIKPVLLVTAARCHADSFCIKSVLLVTAVHCHMLTVFALSQYCWLLLRAATCWLFSHQVTTVGYCCALPHADCFRIRTLYSIQVRLCSTSLCTKLRRASAESEKPAQFREGIQNKH